MKKIILDEETFKVAKKKKKCIYASYEDITKGVNKKDKILINNESKDIKVKVVNKYEAKNLEELKQTLGKRSSYIYPKNIGDKKENIYALELKSSSKIIRKTLLIILLIVVILLAFNAIRVKINNHKTNKLLNEINSIKENEVSYVFIEINPRIVIELKGEKVKNNACLNEDCARVFNNIDIKNKSLKNVINILYNKAKDEGINVTNGVKVSSTNEKIKEKIETIEYVIYEKINKDEEQKLIDEVIDNKETIKNENKKTYNEELLEVYKKDSDYDKLYTCNIENDELSCYMTDSFYAKLSIDDNSLANIFLLIDYIQDLMRLCDKFEIKYTTIGIEGAEVFGIDKLALNQIYINGEYHSWGNGSIGSTDGLDFSYKASIKLDNYDMSEAMMFGYDLHYLPLNKLNLIEVSYKNEDVLVYSR